MGKNFQTTNLFRFSSFLKGASRVIDLSGKLDEYYYNDSSDFLSLKNDWENVGQTIYLALNEYGEEEKKEQK